MFCPRCGSNQDDELRFCKLCGANLYAVKQVVDSKQTVAEMFASSSEAIRRQKELERLQGITPETKRYNEIKAGVITGSVGLALMIFLAVFMQGIIIGAHLSTVAAEVLARVWLAGLIPFFVGLALIFNGYFVTRKAIEAAKREGQQTGELTGTSSDAPALKAANTKEFIPTPFSVTEDTTRHFK